MTLDEFRRHPAYDYYIRTLVSNCLICELDNKFDYKYKNIVYIKPDFENETKDYIIRVLLLKLKMIVKLHFYVNMIVINILHVVIFVH